MVMNVIAILLMGLVGYVWSARGFFSALLNLMVTICAGAVAFALWETVALAVLKGADKDNWFLLDIVWGGSLVALFVVSLAVLSLTVNALVRANIKINKVADWIGGAVCGLGAGFIVSGITIIGTSQVRTPEIENILQYQPLTYDNAGYLKREQLWVPADTWTAGLYGYWSDRSMREPFGGGKTLAAWRPQVADEGHLLRMAEQDVLLRYCLSTNDVKLGGRYTVGKEKPAKPPKGYKAPTTKELIGDNKGVAMLDGTPISGPAYIEGYIVAFLASAKEKGGQVAVGAGSATLVMRNDADTKSITLQPIALISQASGASREFGRWRFDTSNFFVGSMAGATEAPMCFEFLVPLDGENWRPLALYVRGVRFNLTNDDGQVIEASKNFANPEERDDIVSSGTLADEIIAKAKISDPETKWVRDKNSNDSALRINPRMPDNITLNGGELSGIDLSKGQQIVNCVDLRISVKQLADSSVERSLRVEEFQPGPGTSIVTINVSKGIDKFSALEPAATGATGAPTLVDNLGQRYQAIGYIYRDRNDVRIRFTPGSPLTSLGDAPSISRSREDQKLFIVFRVASGVKLKQYAIGDTGIVELQGDLDTGTQNNK